MSELASIGQILRQRREERGLSIEQAAFQSKVPIRLLQALEADDYHLLPDAIYLIRLLHDLALFLKLDPIALETEFRRAIRRPPRQTLAVAPAPPPPPTIPWKQVAVTLAAIMVVLPLVFVALSLMSNRAPEAPAPRVVNEQPRGEQTPVEGSGGIVADRLLALPTDASRTDSTPASPKESGTHGDSVGTRRTGSETPPARREESPPRRETARLTAPVIEGTARRFVLTARGLQPTWISVRADGGEQKVVMLQAGQVVRFAADRGFVVGLGDAGGVDLSLNGAAVPPLGKPGQVVRDAVIPAGAKSPGTPERTPAQQSPRARD